MTRRVPPKQAAKQPRKQPGKRSPKLATRVPRIDLQVLDQARSRVSRRWLTTVVRAVLTFADRLEMPVSLLLTNDAGIASLHAQHLGDPTATDVMSFAIDDAAEVVVSVETARRVAHEHGHDARAELALYIVHGILHVVGYDDVEPRDRRRMRRAEQQVMTRLRIVVRAVDA